MLNSLKKIIKNNKFMLSYIYNLCPSHIFITLFVSVMGSFSSVLNLFITRFIINAIQTGNDDKLFCTVLIMILFLLIVNLVYILINNYIQKIVIPRNTQIICSHMQKELFNKSSIIKMKYYDNPDFFNTFSMALQQSDERAQDVLNTINTFISGLFSIGALFGLVVLLEPFLVILVIINVFVSFYINTVITKLQHNFFKDRIQPQREMEYSGYIFYRMENAKEFRLHKNFNNVLIDKLCNASDKIIEVIKSYGKKLVLYSWMQAMVSNVITSVTLVYLVFKVIKRKLLIGDFVTLSSSAQQLSVHISELINFFPQMYEHSLYIGNFRAFIEYKSPSNYNHGMRISDINSVEFKNICFSYPFSEAEILKDISFKIKKGEKIAIVGENGAGKSTLVKLLTGLYEAKSGDIIVNRNNINTYELNSYRQCIGVAFQDYKMFAVSIAENILMRRLNKTEEDEKLVIEGLKFVGLYEKVMKLPEGIYTKMTKEFNNEGAVFSGGEIQKIALARVYVNNCSLIILDEPSSSLDPLSEYEMFNKMMQLSQNKCLVFISHHLKNIRNVDHIYVFSKGSIIEDGTHNVKKKKRGLYFNMYNKQVLETGSFSN